MNKVLIIAVHPDDETLGCGGTMLKHKANGDEIHWLICTDIDKNNDYYDTRQDEIKKVSNLYSFDTVNNLKLKTMQVDEYSMSELIGKISKVINDVKPNIIYLPFKGDVHSDHRKIFEAAYSCTKSFRYPFIKKVRAYEVLSETEFGIYPDRTFKPNLWIDIGIYFEKKIEIMKIYENEMGSHPFPRSEEAIKALATIRGIVAGVESAESFMSLKEIL